MSRNGHRHPARPRIELGGRPGAGAMPSREEAAAIAAAIQQFMRDTAPAPTAGEPGIGPWQRAALLEGTLRDRSGPSPWGDPVRWGA